MPWETARKDDQFYADAEYKRNRPLAWKRAGGRCELLEHGKRCGSRAGCQVDHIKPRSQGGTHHLDNLRVLCGTHHRIKTAQEGGGYRRQRAPKTDPPLITRTTF